MLLQRLDSVRALAVRVQHDGQRQLAHLECDLEKFRVRQRIASADRDRMKWRASRGTLELLRDRLRSVHRGRLRFCGEAHKKLATSHPHPLRLKPRRDSSEGGGGPRGGGHYRFSTVASIAMRSHS